MNDYEDRVYKVWIEGHVYVKAGGGGEACDDVRHSLEESMSYGTTLTDFKVVRDCPEEGYPLPETVPAEPWPNTGDAHLWAKAFMEHKERNQWSTEDIDEGLMIGWFANAIENAVQIALGKRRSE